MTYTFVIQQYQNHGRRRRRAAAAARRAEEGGESRFRRVYWKEPQSRDRTRQRRHGSLLCVELTHGGSWLRERLVPQNTPEAPNFRGPASGCVFSVHAAARAGSSTLASGDASQLT